MMASSKTRLLGCVLLVVCLCAPMLAFAAPAADSDRAMEFRALATPFSTVLLSRTGARHDDVRRRPSTPSLLTLVPLDGSACDPGRLAVASERRLAHSLCDAEPRTGRSPPRIS